jgi:hypothetical protein
MDRRDGRDGGGDCSAPRGLVRSSWLDRSGEGGARKEEEDIPRLMYLLQVERFREIRVPHLHDQRPVQVEELIPLPIVAIVRVLGLEMVGEDKVDIGDPLLSADDSDLILLQ